MAYKTFSPFEMNIVPLVCSQFSSAERLVTNRMPIHSRPCYMYVIKSVLVKLGHDHPNDPCVLGYVFKVIATTLYWCYSAAISISH